MADISEFTLFYDGKLASDGRLDLYDASQSYYGFARVISILGHYYSTGEIIAQAPHAKIELYLVPPTEGSFKQTVLAGTLGAVLAAPFVSFVDHTVKSWLPQPDSDSKRIIKLLEEQNYLLRQQGGLTKTPTRDEDRHQKEVKTFVEQRQTDIDVMRSITSKSFQNIFRPVGRSADFVGILADKTRRPIGIVDEYTLNLMVTDYLDDDTTTVTGVVNSFSRSSKTGIVFSKEAGRGMRFEYVGDEALKRRDIFSWSQYYGREITMQGQLVRFFDQTIKKLNVFSAEKAEDEEN